MDDDTEAGSNFIVPESASLSQERLKGVSGRTLFSLGFNWNKMTAVPATNPPMIEPSEE